MRTAIAVALAGFQAHIVANLGQPIGLSTLQAFQKMMTEIIEALEVK